MNYYYYYTWRFCEHQLRINRTALEMLLFEMHGVLCSAELLDEIDVSAVAFLLLHMRVIYAQSARIIMLQCHTRLRSYQELVRLRCLWLTAALHSCSQHAPLEDGFGLGEAGIRSTRASLMYVLCKCADLWAALLANFKSRDLA